MASDRLIELPATGPRSAGGGRSLARYVWHARAPVAPTLQQFAARLAEETPDTPGRVHELGRFDDEIAWRTLRDRVLPPLTAALRPKLEWYGCRGAGFHTDAHYSNVLFGAWCLAGPPRDLVFADPRLQLPCPIGELVVFDPFQPHAVLDPGEACYQRERYVAAAASVFLGFELELTDPVCQRFGIGPAEPDALSIGSGTAVNAETGQIAR